MKGNHRSDYKTMAIKAAKDLLYSQDIINQIKKAKTDNEICMIMTKAREGLIK